MPPSLAADPVGPDLRDPPTFERAYREHRPRAFAAALDVLHDARAAEDVAQEVFAQLWRRPRAFDARRGSLRSYVTMLARSRAIDRWRGQAARDAAVERLADVAGTDATHERSAADAAIERERSAQVVSILAGLPSRQREAVVLAFGHQLTAPEIARAVGVPLGTAKSRVRLGLEKLRETAELVA
jgi:RNA polymerase sigma-70 factor, ECF subfamily